MKDSILIELAGTWELQAATGGDGLNKFEPPACAALRMCADALRILVYFSQRAQHEPTVTAYWQQRALEAEAKLSAPEPAASDAQEKKLADIGRAMVNMTTCVRHESEWDSIPAIWQHVMEERDALQAKLAAPAPVLPAGDVVEWERVYTAWRDIGADFAGLDWHEFVVAISRVGQADSTGAAIKQQEQTR